MEMPKLLELPLRQERKTLELERCQMDRNPFEEALKEILPLDNYLRKSVYTYVQIAFRAGVILRNAKAATPHGNWEKLFEQAREITGIHISVRTAQRYMAVAEYLSAFEPFKDAALSATAKTTRASQVKYLEEHGLTSIRKIVRLLEHNKPTSKPSSNRNAVESVSDSAPPWCLSKPIEIPDDVRSLANDLLGSYQIVAGREWLLPAEGFQFEMDLTPTAPEATKERDDSLLLCLGPSNYSTIAQFESLIAEGRRRAGLVVSFAITDAPELRPLRGYTRAFFRDRLVLHTASGEDIASPAPLMLILMANDSYLKKFGQVASQYCDVYLPYTG